MTRHARPHDSQLPIAPSRLSHVSRLSCVETENSRGLLRLPTPESLNRNVIDTISKSPNLNLISPPALIPNQRKFGELNPLGTSTLCFLVRALGALQVGVRFDSAPSPPATLACDIKSCRVGKISKDYESNHIVSI